MRDLELWRRLETGEVAGIEGELAALAERPPAARAPFLGAVARLAEHEEPVAELPPEDLRDPWPSYRDLEVKAMPVKTESTQRDK